MRFLAPAGLLFLGLLALCLFGRRSAEPTPADTPARAPRSVAVPNSAGLQPSFERRRSPASSPARAALSAEEKTRRVEKITRDYDAIRLAALRAYGEAGEAFPGGSHTLQRQLALLEREKRTDLAAVLDPLELEDLELRETHAGQVVQWRLGPTAATDAQRRAVFRWQREFDLRFSGVTEITPEISAERERAHQELRQRIRGVLGDALFQAWLPRDDGSQ